jgi:hypothetical protein
MSKKRKGRRMTANGLERGWEKRKEKVSHALPPVHV